MMFKKKHPPRVQTTLGIVIDGKKWKISLETKTMWIKAILSAHASINPTSTISQYIYDEIGRHWKQRPGSPICYFIQGYMRPAQTPTIALTLCIIQRVWVRVCACPNAHWRHQGQIYFNGTYSAHIIKLGILRQKRAWKQSLPYSLWWTIAHYCFIFQVQLWLWNSASLIFLGKIKR